MWIAIFGNIEVMRDLKQQSVEGPLSMPSITGVNQLIHLRSRFHLNYGKQQKATLTPTLNISVELQLVT